MQYRKLILAAALLTAGAGTVALAAPERGPAAPGYADADATGDSTLTLQELQKRSAERFRAADTDGNGKIDVKEMQAAMLRERADRRVRALDTNGDGAVSAEEFEAPMRWHLAHMDRDDDGRPRPGEMRRDHDRRWDDDRGPRHEGRDFHDD